MTETPTINPIPQGEREPNQPMIPATNSSVRLNVALALTTMELEREHRKNLEAIFAKLESGK